MTAGAFCDQLERLGSELSSIETEDCIIAGDFNARHDLWQSKRPVDDCRGETIVSFMQTHDLELHTPMDLPTNKHTGGAAASTIDLTMSSQSVCLHRLGIAASFTSLGHQPIVFEVLVKAGEGSTQDHTVLQRRQWFQSDTKKLRTAVRTEFSAAITACPSVDEYRNELLRRLDRSIRLARPSQLVNGNSGSRWWWDASCDAAKQVYDTERQAARQRLGAKVRRLTRPRKDAVLNTLVEAESTVKAAQGTFRARLGAAKSTAVRTTLAEIDAVGDWQSVFEMGFLHSRYEDGHFPDLIDASGSVMKTWKAKEATILKYFFCPSLLPASTKHSQCEAPADSKDHPQGRVQDLDVTQQEVEKALSMVDQGRQVGPDGISLQLLRFCWQVEEFRDALLGLYSLCIRDLSFPSAWKEAAVHVTGLPGADRDRTKLQSYRPTWHLSVPSNILDTVILARIQKDSPQLCLPVHTGQDKATKVASILHHTNPSQTAGHEVGILTIDFNDSFHRFSSDQALRQLHACSPRCARLISAWMVGRTVKLCYNGRTSDDAHQVTHGLVPGSPLSSFLWSLHLKAFVTARPLHTDIVDFAYDSQLIVCAKGDTEPDVRRRLRWWHDRFLTWSTEMALVTPGTMMDAKISYMLAWTRYRAFSVEPQPLSLQDRTVDPQGRISIVGVTIDRDLGGASHCLEQVKSAMELFRVLVSVGRLSGDSLGPSLRRRLIETLVMPKLDTDMSALLPLPGGHFVAPIVELDRNMARFVFGLPLFGTKASVSLTPLLYELHWLPSLTRWRRQRMEMALELIGQDTSSDDPVHPNPDVKDSHLRPADKRHVGQMSPFVLAAADLTSVRGGVLPLGQTSMRSGQSDPSRDHQGVADVKHRIAEHFITDMAERLAEHTVSFQSYRIVNPAFQPQAFDRYGHRSVQAAATLLQWRTGAVLRFYRSGIVKTCRCGVTDPDARHFLLECQNTVNERCSLFRLIDRQEQTLAYILDGGSATIAASVDRLLESACRNVLPPTPDQAVAPHYEDRDVQSVRDDYHFHHSAGGSRGTSEGSASQSTMAATDDAVSTSDRRPNRQIPEGLAGRVSTFHVPKVVPAKHEAEEDPYLMAPSRQVFRLSGRSKGINTDPAEASSNVSTRQKSPQKVKKKNAKAAASSHS